MYHAVIDMDSITKSNWLKGVISLISHEVITFPTFLFHTHLKYELTSSHHN